MAWTDYSTTDPGNWASTIGSEISVVGVVVALTEPPHELSIVVSTADDILEHTPLDKTYNIPGFGAGFQPASTPAVIANNIDEGGGGGGGGSTRPTSGFLYPRGQG